MAGSVVLDTAIGLVFLFLTVSLICTGILEWISSRLNKRGEYLLKGLREMLDLPPSTPGNPAATGLVGEKEGLGDKGNRRVELQNFAQTGAALSNELAAATAPVRPSAALGDLVLAHPLVAVLHRPANPGRPGGKMHLASYLSGRTFASSLIDLLVQDSSGNTSIAKVQSQVEKLDVGIPARAALLALLRDSGQDIDRFRRSLEGWYDEQMGRVSGWYKRWAQYRLFIGGLLLVVLVNVDTLGIATALYRDQPVRQAVVAQALNAQGCPSDEGPVRTRCLGDQQQTLNNLRLPVGWSAERGRTACKVYRTTACGYSALQWAPFWWHVVAGFGFAGVLLKLLGWLLTALAVSLGAPFWFDALGKLGSLRTAGRRPGENQPYEARP